MQDVIPKDSRYVPLTQQKWCCVPTCIQMVMLRHKIPLIPAELIGYHMGLVVPVEGRKFFYNPRVGDKPPAGYGTQVSKAEYSPNEVFRKLNIPLKMSWTLIDKLDSLDSFKTYLSQAFNKYDDLLTCYDWPTLFDKDATEHWGHVCVLDKVDIENNEVRFIDPSVSAPKWNTVSIESLFEAMIFHGKEKSGGFWELTLKE